MFDNPFFTPTLLFKEYLILDMISNMPNVTQRKMCEALGVSVSMVNQYLDDFEERSLIRRLHKTKKLVQYELTPSGVERHKVLNIGYIKSSQQVYEAARKDIAQFLRAIHDRGFRKIILYGAGEVAEAMLQVLEHEGSLPEVVAIVDDDPAKQGKHIGGVPILSYADGIRRPHDGILVSSYMNHDIIFNKLLASHYDKAKIVQFFD